VVEVVAPAAGLVEHRRAEAEQAPQRPRALGGRGVGERAVAPRPGGGRRHVRTRDSSRSPTEPKSTLGSQAASSGCTIAWPPIALVSWMRIRKRTVVPRLMPTPYAAPPRWVLVAR